MKKRLATFILFAFTATALVACGNAFNEAETTVDTSIETEVETSELIATEEPTEEPYEHAYAEEETTPATCKEVGKKTATCTVCGGLVSEDIPVDANNHSFGEWTEVTPGNCTTPAKLERVCAHDASHVETKDGEIAAFVDMMKAHQHYL